MPSNGLTDSILCYSSVLNQRAIKIIRVVSMIPASATLYHSAGGTSWMLRQLFRPAQNRQYLGIVQSPNNSTLGTSRSL